MKTFLSSALVFSFILLLAACAKPDRTALIEEIRSVEKQFETDLNAEGAAAAFERYAAPDAVIMRQNDTLVHGPAGIRTFYSAASYKNAKAYWAPDFIEVSADGTMGYTYGKYRWIAVDTAGQSHEYKGVFHTVWQRQSDGKWKYVWD